MHTKFNFKQNVICQRIHDYRSNNFAAMLCKCQIYIIFEHLCDTVVLHQDLTPCAKAMSGWTVI